MKKFRGWCHTAKRHAWEEKQIKQNAILNFIPTIKNQSREIMKLKHDLYLFVDEKIPQDNGRFIMFSVEARGWRHSTKTSQQAFHPDDGKNPKCSTKLNFYQLCLTQICCRWKEVHSFLNARELLPSLPPFHRVGAKKGKHLEGALPILKISLFSYEIGYTFSLLFCSSQARLLAKNNINNKTFIFFVSQPRFMHNSEIYSSQLSRNNIKNV